MRIDEKLNSLWINFLWDWRRCREVWRDEVALSFEKEFVEPLNSAMEKLLLDLRLLENELIRMEIFARER